MKKQAKDFKAAMEEMRPTKRNSNEKTFKKREEMQKKRKEGEAKNKEYP